MTNDYVECDPQTLGTTREDRMFQEGSVQHFSLSDSSEDNEMKGTESRTDESSGGGLK